MGDATSPKRTSSPSPPPPTSTTYDNLIIGAGLSGLHALHHLRQQSPQPATVIIESAPSVGGTWWWNRYPGARFDSESYSYAYSFSPELLAEWNWTEHFAPQAETLRYIEHVTERFDLRKDIRFMRRVESAYWEEEAREWEVRVRVVGEDSDGGVWGPGKGEVEVYRTKFLITAVGPLSTPTMPRIPGVGDFKGEAYHTARWPADREVSFEGKRVGIIGTGATGVQTIQEVVKTAGSLTIFQRTPNW
jgi:cation diffusion facilitator CzcD-associated flavoprotein CzcO